MSLSFKKLKSFELNAYKRAASHEADSDFDDHRLIGMYPSDLEYESSVPDSAFNIPKLGHISHIREKTSISTQINRIKDRRTVEALKKKKRVKDIKSVKDWWVWYWQHPIGRFPFLYFFITLLLSIIFSVYWFMDNDSAYILCGITGLSMSSYAFYKFLISQRLKKEIDKYQKLNLEFRLENIKLDQAVTRAHKAVELLKKTRKRLSKANNRNRKNLQKFEKVEYNMQLVGKKAKLNLTEVNKMTNEIREKWRCEYLNNEREMLHAVFNRYERKHTGKSNLGMTQEDFKEFQSMLPNRYQSRFDRLGTFHTLAGVKSMIDIHDFANTLDVFAEMETDDRDIYIQTTPKVKSHARSDVSSFDFQTKVINQLDSPQASYERSPKKQVHFRK
eukprot:109593_1